VLLPRREVGVEEYADYQAIRHGIFEKAASSLRLTLNLDDRSVVPVGRSFAAARPHPSTGHRKPGRRIFGFDRSDRSGFENVLLNPREAERQVHETKEKWQ